MKKVIFMMCAMLFSTGVFASQWTGNVNFFLAQKSLDKEDWSPVKKQDEFGVMLDFKDKSWPVSIAVDYLIASQSETLSGTKYTGTTYEFGLGVRKIWVSEGSIRPHIGGGLASIAAEAETNDGNVLNSNSNDAIGLWINGGVYWILGDHFNLGLQARYSNATVRVSGVNVNAGGVHSGLVLGYHW